MSRLAACLLACLVLAACSGGGGGDAAAAADTLTRAQKDSMIVRSGIPGSGAVGRALDAAGRASERAAAHDSIGG